MREVMLRGLGLLALVVAVGCGGPVENEPVETELATEEQQLPMCKVDVPQPCPTGYTCVGKTCYPYLEP